MSDVGAEAPRRPWRPRIRAIVGAKPARERVPIAIFVIFDPVNAVLAGLRGGLSTCFRGIRGY